jgi:hypothetical protein
VSLTRCPYCEDQHACHRVDGADPGRVLYEKLYGLWTDGTIGTPVIKWDELSLREQDEWKKIAVE